MGNRARFFSILLLALLAPAPAALAEEAAAPTPAAVLRDVKDYLGLSVYLQGGYTHSFTGNLAGDENIPLRVFDQKDDTFLIDLAELNLYRAAPATGGVGYGFKLAAGETAKFIHAAGLFEGESIDLTEAYLEAVAPLGRGIKFTFGKFVTMHGAEVIEAAGGVNYSRSFLFNFAIPFTHTGLKVAYPFTDWLSASFHVVNGWDNFEENNDGKTMGYTVCLTPADWYGLTVNFMHGPEQADNNSNVRYLLDVVGTVKPKVVPGLTLVVNYDWGYEEDALGVDENARWWGVAGYVAYQLSEMLSGAVRAETFNDPSGFRGVGGRVYEVTVTPQLSWGGLKVRPEYRHDWSPADVFNGEDSQDTVALGLMYTW
jgi:hypothetical protein